MDGQGFTPETWRKAAVFKGRCADPHDVDSKAAVYALADTWNARPIDMDLPQPVIWWDDEGEEEGALAIQAECHETEDGDTMEVLGLLLPDGHTAVALLDDVDLVDSTDPVWRALVEPADDEDDGEFADYLLDDDEDDDDLP
jgi:hypothetical protein